MLRLLFWSSLPFVLPQALWVRHTAPRFADAAGPREGVTGSGSERVLVALGDSIVAGVGARRLEDALVGQVAARLAALNQTAVRWHAVGRTGITSTGVLDTLLDQLPDVPADYVLLNVGVNDLTRLTMTARFLDNIERLSAALEQRYPGARIAVNGLPPLGLFPLLPQPLRAILGLRARLFNRALAARLRDTPGIVFIPVEFDAKPDSFADDGFHPSAASYAIFGRAVADAMVVVDDTANAIA